MHNDILAKKLKRVIDKKGIRLKEYGINSFGFYRKDALKIIDLLEEMDVPILGGDVYRIDKNKFVPTYDSWSADDSRFPLSQYSARLSRRYITSYKETIDGNFLYVLVTSSDFLSVDP